MLREGDTWKLCGLYAVTFGGFVGLASFLADLLHDQYGLIKVDAASLAAIGGAAGSFPAPVRRPPRRPLRRHPRAGLVYGLAAPLLLLLSTIRHCVALRSASRS